MPTDLILFFSGVALFIYLLGEYNGYQRGYRNGVTRAADQVGEDAKTALLRKLGKVRR